MLLTMSTVMGMADLPFGFSAGDDPDRENDPESGSGSADPFGLGGLGGEFNVADLGQMFTRLGQMFSGAGSGHGRAILRAGELRAGPPDGVELDRIRGPHPVATREAIGDAVHLAETWLNGVTALPEGTTKVVAWTSQRLGGQHPGDLETVVRSDGPADLHGVGVGAAGGGPGHGRAR